MMRRARLDKTAKILGFPPGECEAIESPQAEIPMPIRCRAHSRKSTCDFSFGNLKTAVSLLVRKLEGQGELKPIADVCASIQNHVDALLQKNLYRRTALRL